MNHIADYKKEVFAITSTDYKAIQYKESINKNVVLTHFGTLSPRIYSSVGKLLNSLNNLTPHTLIYEFNKLSSYVNRAKNNSSFVLRIYLLDDATENFFPLNIYINKLNNGELKFIKISCEKYNANEISVNIEKLPNGDYVIDRVIRNVLLIKKDI